MRAFALSLVALMLASPSWARGRGNRQLLVATSSSQAIQNARANRYDLSRMRNDAMVRRFYHAGYLVRVPSRTRSYYLHAVPVRHRYLRPWTRLFLDRLSREYHARFRHRLRITSLVRTVSSQRRLGHRNPNAADATGPSRSAHLTGAALDISKRFMNAREIEWVRSVLYQLKRAGYLYAIEEFEEPDFHVMVYPTYRAYVARLLGRPQGVEQSDARLSPSGDSR